MVLYLNEGNHIKAVGYSEDETLTRVEVTDKDNPFIGKTVEEICCYEVGIEEDIEGYNKITYWTPYVDMRLLDAIVSLSNKNLDTQAQVDYLTMMSGY